MENWRQEWWGEWETGHNIDTDRHTQPKVMTHTKKVKGLIQMSHKVSVFCEAEITEDNRATAANVIVTAVTS